MRRFESVLAHFNDRSSVCRGLIFSDSPHSTVYKLVIIHCQLLSITVNYCQLLSITVNYCQLLSITVKSDSDQF